MRNFIHTREKKKRYTKQFKIYTIILQPLSKCLFVVVPASWWASFLGTTPHYKKKINTSINVNSITFYALHNHDSHSWPTDQPPKRRRKKVFGHPCKFIYIYTYVPSLPHNPVPLNLIVSLTSITGEEASWINERVWPMILLVVWRDVNKSAV